MQRTLPSPSSTATAVSSHEVSIPSVLKNRGSGFEARGSGGAAVARHQAISRTVAAVTGRATPRSLTIAVTSSGGVTSNAGL